MSTEIILGKTTENTVMELNAEGGTSFKQLQDLIKKECGKQDKNIDPWNKNTINYKNRSNTCNHKKLANEGPMWRLKQKEIETDKPSKDAKPMRLICLKVTSSTILRPTQKS